MANATPINRSWVRKIIRLVLLFLLAVILAAVILALVPLGANEVRVDLTRFLYTPAPSAEGGATAQGTSLNQSFVAEPGPGRLLVASECLTATPEINLNGTAIRLPGTNRLLSGGHSARPVVLERSNRIDIVWASARSDCGDIRIKQSVDVVTHALSRVHFNTNVSDFAAARKFYGELGFSTVSGFPDTNTQAMARAIGINTPTTYDGSKGDHAGGYLLHGELVGPGGFAGGVIDLIEFTIPRNEESPYQQLNHLGMARAVMHTDNLQSSWESLNQLGVEFISAPVMRDSGYGFAIFRDLDGTSYELRQDHGSSASITASKTATTRADAHGVGITRLGAVNVNVSDLERSGAWYQMLGFARGVVPLTPPDLAEAKALGFSGPVSLQGEAVTHRVDGSVLELVQWLEPFDASAPYDLPVNHLGIHRMAFATSDIEADVATLVAQGVTLVSPITPCCSGDDSWGSIVAFEDPDGTILELVEQPMITPVITLSVRLGRLTDFLSSLF